MILASAIILTLGVLAYTLVVRERDLPEPLPESPAQHLEERKAQIYENLRDLQFEFRVGKLSDADYQRTKLDLQKELADVMGQIDAVLGKTRTMVAVAPAPRPAPPANTCPKCKARFDKPMKFCGECGQPMEGAAS